MPLLTTRAGASARAFGFTNATSGDVNFITFYENTVGGRVATNYNMALTADNIYGIGRYDDASYERPAIRQFNTAGIPTSNKYKYITLSANSAGGSFLSSTPLSNNRIASVGYHADSSGITAPFVYITDSTLTQIANGAFTLSNNTNIGEFRSAAYEASSDTMIVGGQHSTGGLAYQDYLIASYTAGYSHNYNNYFSLNIRSSETIVGIGINSGSAYLIGQMFSGYYGTNGWTISKMNISTGTISVAYTDIESMTFRPFDGTNYGANIYSVGMHGNGVGVAKHLDLGSTFSTVFCKALTPPSSTTYGRAITVDSSENIYVVGDHMTNGTFIAKLDSSGNLLWQRSMTLGTYMYPQSCKVVGDKLYVAGYGYNNYSGNNYWYSFVFCVPTDGSKTGTYTVGAQTAVYAASSYTFGTATNSGWNQVSNPSNQSTGRSTTYQTATQNNITPTVEPRSII